VVDAPSTCLTSPSPGDGDAECANSFTLSVPVSVRGVDGAVKLNKLSNSSLSASSTLVVVINESDGWEWTADDPKVDDDGDCPDKSSLIPEGALQTELLDCVGCTCELIDFVAGTSSGFCF